MQGRVFGKCVWVGVVVAALWVVAEGPANGADREIVRFRLSAWKAAHFNDAKQAQQHHDTLKKIGCEVKKHAHGDHIDVSYRCPAWRSISLTSHDEAHQWEKWLKSIGFETSHVH